MSIIEKGEVLPVLGKNYATAYSLTGIVDDFLKY